MKRIALTLACLVCLSAAHSAELVADLILHNGKVYSQRGWTEAIAIKDGVVAAVGTNARIDRLRGPMTKVIDLQGAPVLPGLNDTHAHPVSGALERAGCRVPAAPLDAIVEAIRACAATTPKGQWIVTGSVDESVARQGQPKALLDAAAPANPVLISIIGGHTLLVNTLALNAGGIDKSTPAPPGAEIGRDASGELNGVLKEVSSFWSVVPPPDPKMVAEVTRPILDMFLQAGVTSITEANSSPWIISAYSYLVEQKQLRPRVRTCALWEPPLSFDEVASAVKATQGRLDAGCVKIFVDGETYSGRTAVLFEPYQPADGSRSDERGSMRLSPEELRQAVVHFDKAGLTLKFHAWGDAAIAATITAIEAARKANGQKGPRHEIGHSFLVRKSDIERGRRAKVLFEFSPYGWQPPGADAVGRELGPQRLARMWPVRDVLDAGAMTAGGSDWPSGPPVPYNLWYAIETLVTRLDAGMTTGAPLAPTQRITLKEAIDMYTAGPALASGPSDAPGIIALGRKADLIVLDRNPFAIPITEVHDVHARTTIVGGEVVYDAGGASTPL